MLSEKGLVRVYAKERFIFPYANCRISEKQFQTICELGSQLLVDFEWGDWFVIIMTKKVYFQKAVPSRNTDMESIYKDFTHMPGVSHEGSKILQYISPTTHMSMDIDDFFVLGPNGLKKEDIQKNLKIRGNVGLIFPFISQTKKAKDVVFETILGNKYPNEVILDNFNQNVIVGVKDVRETLHIILEGLLVCMGMVFSVVIRGKKYLLKTVKLNGSKDTNFCEVDLNTKIKIVRSHNNEQTHSKICGEVYSQIKSIIEYGCDLKGVKKLLLVGGDGSGKSDILREVLCDLDITSNVIFSSLLYSEDSENVVKKLEWSFDCVKGDVADGNDNVVSLFIDDIQKIASKERSHKMISNALIRCVRHLEEFHRYFYEEVRVILVFGCNEIEQLDFDIRKIFDFEICIERPNMCEVEYMFRNILFFESHEHISRLCGFVNGLSKEEILFYLLILFFNYWVSNHEENINFLYNKFNSFDISNSFKFFCDDRKSRSRVFLENHGGVMGWEGIGGYENIKRVLSQSIEWPIKYRESFLRLGLTPNRGILLHGPPGCSKTSIVRNIINQIGIEHIVLDGSEIYSRYLGESERLVREVFSIARTKAPCIVFFDELDSIVGHRGMGDCDMVQERILSTFLNEMDGIEPLCEGVIVIAATNMIERIDSALLRPGRFDKLIHVPLPSVDSIGKILDVHTKKLDIFLDVGSSRQELLSKLSRILEGFSGADCAQVCRDVAFRAIRETIEKRGDSFNDKDRIYVREDHFIKSIEDLRQSKSSHI